MNRICEILEIEKPVVQAPMLWITSPEMAAAVSNAGGLGVLGFCAGYETVAETKEETMEEMRKAIRKTKELTDKPFGIDIAPKADDTMGFSEGILDVIRDEGVNIIVYAGDNLDKNEIKELKDEGFKIIARQLNPTVRGAQMLEDAGVDMIVATGVDEGGCMPSGTNGTMSMTALLADNVDIPVLAAGGIVNDKMAKAAEAVGAEGVFAGSRFILSEECRSADSVKEDLLNTHPDDYIVFTQWDGNSKWRSTPHATAKEALEENKKGNLNPSPGSLYESMYKGNLEKGVNSASNAISLVKEINTCEEIVDELAKPFLD